MPPELAEYEVPPPEGMPEPLTMPYDYWVVWTAIESNMTPGEFRLLPWEEQAELIAWHMVKQKVQAYYHNEINKYYKAKMESKS